VLLVMLQVAVEVPLEVRDSDGVRIGKDATGETVLLPVLVGLVLVNVVGDGLCDALVRVPIVDVVLMLPVPLEVGKLTPKPLTRRMALEEKGMSQSERPSNVPLTNALEPMLRYVLLVPTGHALNALMRPLRTSTRTTAVAFFGTSHTASPSNTAPWNACNPTVAATEGGHKPSARMLPVETSTSTTAAAFVGASHTERPSNVPPWKA
jgi:hypothetical protein